LRRQCSDHERPIQSPDSAWPERIGPKSNRGAKAIKRVDPEAENNSNTDILTVQLVEGAPPGPGTQTLPSLQGDASKRALKETECYCSLGGVNMGRLVIVSNRVPDPEGSQQSGGLAVAVLDAVRENGGIWFGWNGQTDESADSAEVAINEHDNIVFATFALSGQDYQDHYLGFSNSALWPVFHNRLDLARFSTPQIEGYRRVNANFATRLSPLLRSDDLIWIHDYHLIPFAAHLRALGHDNRIGFFLHIPFPTPDVLAAVPEHTWLVRSLFSYDLVGFQTVADLINFQRFLIDIEGATLSGSQLTRLGESVIGAVFPIGIDVDAFAAMAHTPQAEERIERLHRRAVPRTHIIGVDRLDYTKGLPERLRAFQRLLELHPENQKVATLMQIAAPTREDVAVYTQIRQELEQLSGAINGQFGDFDWTPVRYIHRSVARDTLAALFRGSHVGLVTPLRDGMNLVAKEYVAAQDEHDPGVLILSRFAGAAEDLEEALIVNPYDADEVAHALQCAIKMPLPERRERHGLLLQRVRNRDAQHWREGFLHMLAECERG
jgi:trehalose 6-phosphate synthase